MKKCKNCRHVNRDTESFCEECGAPLMNELMHQEENQAQPSMNKGNESTPLRSKRSWIWVFLFVFIVLGAGSYFLGTHYFSKEQQISHFIEAIENGDAQELSKKMRTNESEFQVNPQSIKPLITYYQKNPTELKKLEKALLKDKKLHGLTIRETSQTAFFFHRYQFILTPVSVQLTTNQRGVTLAMNGREVGTSDSTTYQKELGPLAPGQYTFTATVKDSTGEPVITEEYRLLEEENYISSIPLDFKRMNFVVESNLPDADIYINDRKVGTLTNGSKTIVPLFWSKGMTIQLKKTINGEEIQTSKETIGENDFVEALSDNPTLQLNFPLASDYDARKALETFYQAFAKQVKSHTDSTEFAKKYLVGGENNPQFPSFIESLERLREKKSTDVSPDFEVTINTLQLDGKENYHVNYYLEAKNSKAKENGLRYEWINGLNDQIHLVKEPLKEGQLQFVSIDEQTLAWLEKIL